LRTKGVCLPRECKKLRRRKGQGSGRSVPEVGVAKVKKRVFVRMIQKVEDKKGRT